jgi:ribonuclease BN (tRNA processing enzyme)
MKLIFAGAGSAFTVGNHNYNSNILLESDKGKRLLIDCGSDARHSLHDLGFSYVDIQNVYISHLHADHVGGLEWLGFTSKFDPNVPKPNLYISKKIVSRLWEHVLSGSLASIPSDNPSLKDYFVVHSVEPKGSFRWQNITFHLVETIHVDGAWLKMPSFGLFFTIRGTKIFITTDTQFTPRKLMPFYKKADVIFQDCETSKYNTGVHAHYSQLLTLDSDIRKKMWLYHYNPGPKPDAEQDGFKGFVKVGQVFKF